MSSSVKKIFAFVLAWAMVISSISAFDGAAKSSAASKVPTGNISITASSTQEVPGSTTVTGVNVPTNGSISCYYNPCYMNSIATASAVVVTGNSISVKVVATKGAVSASGAAVDVMANNATIASVTVNITGVTTSVKGTKTLKVATSEKVITAGKYVTVKYTVKKTAAATAAKKVYVSSDNEEVVKATINRTKKYVKLSVPATAIKGSTANVTLTSGKKTATISVKVRNKVEKIAAKKKYATIARKKQVKVKFNMTTQNSEYLTTDSVSAVTSKKCLKIKGVTVKNKKVVVTVLTKKRIKRYAVVTVTAGSYTATACVKAPK